MRKSPILTNTSLFGQRLARYSTGVYNITVVGPGGLGGYYGGKLALAYAASRKYKIYFVARGEHGEKIRREGLELITSSDIYKTIKPTQVVKSIQELPKQDLVILAVKYYDLIKILSELKNVIHDNTYLMPLLNGVSSGERIRKDFPEGKVIEACTYTSAAMISPGVVKQFSGTGELSFGSDYVSSAQLEEVRQILVDGGINATLNQNIRHTMWNKYLFVCPMSCMTVAYSTSKQVIFNNPDLALELRTLTEEMVLVAQAKGIHLEKDIVDRTITNNYQKSIHTVPSMKLDFDRNKQIEIEIFPEYILEEAQRLKVAVPAHTAILSKLQARLASRKTFEAEQETRLISRL